MRKIFYLILLFTSYLESSWDELFNQHEDPCLYHHVNVLSGTLNLNFIDATISGEVPIVIRRNYSSQGGLERTKVGFDLLLKELRGGYMIQGGWDFFSYTNLLVYQSANGAVRAYLAEPCGGMLNYEVHETISRNEFVLKPISNQGKCFGVISAATNIINYRMSLDVDKGIAILQLPDGGKRTYFRVIHQIKNKEIKLENVYYRLVEEVLPSGHIVDYFYDKLTRLERIETKSPDRQYCYAALDFNLLRTKTPSKFQLNASDGRIFLYGGLTFEGRDYLSYKITADQAATRISYEPGRKNTGAFLKEVYQDQQLLFSVDYYRPKSAFADRLIDRDESKKDLCCDKVKTLFIPDPKTGEKTVFANFFYERNCTVVKNFEGTISKYHHIDGKLQQIDFFDQEEKIHSSMKFIWDHHFLKAKLLLDANGLAIISKVFVYDARGNVTQETLFGDLTGEREGPFTYDFEGCLDLADSFTKKYSYESNCNRLISEAEEDGLVYEYSYLKDTNLLEKKITKYEDKILLREFYFYDKNHLLIEEVIDDGINSVLRQQKKYIRDHQTGTIKEQIDGFYDPKLKNFVQIKRLVNFYGENKKLAEVHFYDADDKFVSLEKISYNLSGKIIKKENNFGEESVYEYDLHENLIKQKEVGLACKNIQYDCLKRPVSLSIGINQKNQHTVYDLKGNPVFQINERGQKTEQKFDEFGHCLEAVLPEVLDEEGNSYLPKLSYEYDIQGNLIKVTDPLKQVIETSYTLYRKPKKIIQKDGTITQNTYYKNGQLKKTKYPDSSYFIREYDPFSRLKKETFFSAKGEILSEEAFEYGVFFLKSFKDKNGLETNYKYDFKGQLIEKVSGNRKVRFSYDSQQRLTKEIYPDYEKCIFYNPIGLTKQTLEINHSGKVTNKKKYFYDHERRLVKITSQLPHGKFNEILEYDDENRIIFYQDASGGTIRVSYEEISQYDSSFFLQKKTIDQINQIKIENFDALNRLTEIELQDEFGNCCGKTEIFYDHLGNQSKVIYHVYENTQFKKKKTFKFFYDSMGRKISEYEDDQIIKEYSYDLLGNLAAIFFPSGKIINYHFDSIKRLTEVFTNDNKIHYTIDYLHGNKPICLRDHQNNTCIKREYNQFGELIAEQDCNGLLSAWDYDDQGKVICYRAPDQSLIHYSYQDQFMDQLVLFDSQGNIEIQHKFLSYDNTGNLEAESYHSDFGINYYRYDEQKRPIATYNSYFNQNAKFNISGQLESYQNTYEKKKFIQYDPLGQIIKEGKQSFFFDSIGNPTKGIYNKNDQLSELNGWKLTYDKDGNLIQKSSDDDVICYSYDSMNRLFKINHKAEETIFIYDPLSRVIEKNKNGKRQLFIYEEDQEIGSMVSNKIEEMKILHPDKRRILYLKLAENIFIPQSDFQGNIRALFDTDGKLIESISMDSFGKTTNKFFTNIPWKFSGKREIEGLYLFNHRFYDPDLMRWLNRDPLGFVDGYNLYAFVLNRPCNRFDELGLYSKDYFPCDIEINVPIQLLIDAGESKGVIAAKGLIGGVQVDWMISCGHFHELQFRADEIECGKVNIVEHFAELIPKEGKLVGLITAQNGINTTLEEFKEFNKGLLEKSLGSTLIIGLHNPTQGVLLDLKRVLLEATFIETAAVAKTRQFLEAISYSIHQVNSDLLWSHIVHSEAGVITKRAIESMHPEAQEKVKEQLKICALGPVSPIPNQMALEVENIYSSKDFITGGMGVIYSFGKDYNISFKKCVSRIKERSLYFADHAFLGNTYQTAIETKFMNEKNLLTK